MEAALLSSQAFVGFVSASLCSVLLPLSKHQLPPPAHFAHGPRRSKAAVPITAELNLCGLVRMFEVCVCVCGGGWLALTSL